MKVESLILPLGPNTETGLGETRVVSSKLYMYVQIQNPISLLDPR